MHSKTVDAVTQAQSHNSSSTVIANNSAVAPQTHYCFQHLNSHFVHSHHLQFHSLLSNLTNLPQQYLIAEHLFVGRFLPDDRCPLGLHPEASL
jgi:hypothetical protein